MSDVNANIGIHFDTSDALAQLRRLQAGLSKFNQSLTEGNVAAANAQKGLNSQLIQSINSTGKFVASQKTIATSTTAFTDALEKNKLSMGQYFRYTAAAGTMNSKTLRNLFTQEKDILKRAMKDRVKTLQTQYVQLTNANGEFVKVLQVVPKHLKMVNGQYADYATRTQMAAQRQQFLNQLLKQGSTQLLNFGKNTQWAGRQLMVGLTIPLSILGSTAAKVFREMEEATVRFTRVYGDLTTSIGDTDKAVAEIQLLAKEFTKFGIAAKDTMEMAATAAAMGLTGTDLQAQVINSTRLAVLGQVEQQQALETTISLTNAFGVATEDLAQKINFLNAVENQTVLSIEDLTIAIPKAGPVVKQLGGSVEDLAFFMTAMKEGGINASQGANALKSGLASLINPAEKSAKFLAELGININGIVEANAGDLKGTVVGFAQALDTLDPLNRARAIEQLFGKFQFARLSTLFQNVTKDSSQAARALDLAGSSVEELAILSERELGKVEDAVGVKFQKQLENLKLQLIPIGKAFLEAITPVVQFAAKMLEKFNNLSDGTKKFVVGFIGIIGGIAPIVLMTVGLVANGVANLIKFFAMLRGGIAQLNGQNNVLGGGFDYLTQAETENLAQTQALHVSHTDLISTFNVEKTSVDLLAAAYQNAASQARALASGSPALFNAVPGPKGAVSGLPKFADGKVPGNESKGDSILALVAPGETIVPTALSKKYAPLLKGIMGDDLPGFKTGRYIDQASQSDKRYSASQAAGDPSVQQYIDNELGRIRNLSQGALIKYAEATGKDVSDVSETALGKIRDAIVSDFKKIVEEVKAEAGKVTEAGIESIGKKFDPAKGSSRMGAYAPKFDQLQRKEFAHVGQTKAMSSSYEQDDGLDLIPAARNQVELIKKFYGDGGGSGSGEMPDLKVANAHAFMLKGTLNNAMSTKGKSQSYEAKNGAGSLGRDFQADFEQTGAEKWKAMTTMMGGDFDQLKSQVEVYDNLLVDKLSKWNADNAAKPMPEIFDDATFEMLESQVTLDLQRIAPEFASIVELAKTKITGIRISLGEDFDEVNAMLKANNAGTLGTSSSNSKILNHEARPDDPKMLGTMRPQAIADAVDADLTAAEQKAETKSPSKRTQRLGKDIADGLALGLAEGKDGVKAQSSQLTDAALPTAAETEARTSKMDLGNKAFYDDLDTSEMRDERQILKSQDRQRRKLGATATVDSMSTAKVKKQQKLIANGTKEQGDLLRKTVDGSEDLAESTTIVAEQTDEIATVTGDIVPAQTGNLDNVMTTAALNDAIVGTTGDIHGSVIDTAMSQEEITQLQEQEKFLREQLNGELAQQNAALAAGSDLSQTGKKRYTIDQALDEAYGDGTPENPGYTMDKNGRLLFDPELDADGKKRPTTMTEKQIKKKKRGMRREKVGKYSGKATGILGAATMVSGMAGAPPQVTAALGAATTVAQFAPMLAGMGPVGWAAAGIMAVGAGAYMLNQHFNKMAAESAKFVLATSATRDSMKKMGEMTGNVGASQIMDRRRQGSQYTKYNESYKVPEKFGKKFMSSDLGKDTKKTFKENTKKFGNEKAIDDLGLKLAAQIADGVLSQEQAESISQALALSLKDQKVQMQVTGRIRTLLGPNGENLEKEPLETRLNLIANARARSTKTLGNIEKDGKAGKSQRKDIAAIAALNMNNLEMTTMMSDQLEVQYETQKKKLEAELASTTNAQNRLELEEKIKKVTADATLATETMNSQLVTQIALGQRDFNKMYSGSVWGGQAMREDAFFDGQSASVKAAYKGTDQENSADKFLKETKGFETGATYANTKVNGQYVTNGLQSGKAAQQFQAKLQMLVGGKVLRPDEAMSYTKMFAGKLGQLNQLLTLSLVERGTAKTKELFNMFAGFKSKATATKLVKYMVQLEKGPKFDQNMETLKNLQALDGLTIDMELVLKGGSAVLEEIQRRQDLLEKLKTETEAEDKKSGKTTTADEFLEKSKKATPEDIQAIESLQKNVDKMAEFRKLTRDQQTEYLQKLAIGYTYEKGLNDEQIKADAELFIEKQMITNADYRLLQDGTQAYKDARAKLLTDYMSQTAGDRAQTNLDIGVVKGIDIKGSGADGGGGKTERDTTYDELMKRLRNVRNSALDAAGGFKELQKAIAATGSKSIGNKFKGLEQQLIKMGQTSQFTDYLASLDTKDLKKFAYTATAADVKKKKGKQKYTQVDPETGKMVTKYQKFKAGDTVLTQKGRDMEQGYKKAIIGDYNKAQLQSLKLANQEISARGKLLALGFDELDIQTMLADENYKTLIATGKVTKAELETNAALTKQARIRNQINGAVAGQKDLQKTTDNQKRIPEVVAMMQQGGMSAEAIRAAISDPAILDTLINGMDNFGTLAKYAQDEFNDLLSQINEIPERKIIELVFTQTREEKIINAANAAAEMFDAYKMIDENTLTNKEGNTFAGLQVQMEDLNNQAKIAQNAINLTQSKIDDMQKAVDADQRKIEEDFTRPIEKKQREIEKLTRSAELNFTRPIQALQERSSILSHDLDVMNKAAEAINEKYDKQQEALTKVAEINQQIINQQQQQLGLADALSQGDISAAAKAVQDIRATNASNYATNAQDALQKARENEVGGLRGGVSGLSQKQIEAEQYDISQKVYDLELKKAAVDKEILAIQDSIYTLEQSRQVALDAIQVKTDAIAKITFGTLLDQQNKLKAINDQILPLQSQSDLLAAQITANDRNRIIQGQTREEWDLTLKAAQAAEKLAKGDLALALAGINSVSGTVKGAWDSIKSSYDAIKDKSITITQHIVTTYGTALGLPDPNAGKTDPNAGKTDPQADAAAKVSPSALAAGESGAIGAASIAAQLTAAAKTAASVSNNTAQGTLNKLKKMGFMSSGGMVPKYFASGGMSRGTDTIPAMLTPGEFVMSRYAVDTHGTDKMKAINSGASLGDSVYNYNLSVNVKSDANPNEIAKTVMAQIKQIDSQRMRGTRI